MRFLAFSSSSSLNIAPGRQHLLWLFTTNGLTVSNSTTVSSTVSTTVSTTVFTTVSTRYPPRYSPGIHHGILHVAPLTLELHLTNGCHPLLLLWSRRGTLCHRKPHSVGGAIKLASHGVRKNPFSETSERKHLLGSRGSRARLIKDSSQLLLTLFFRCARACQATSWKSTNHKSFAPDARSRLIGIHQLRPVPEQCLRLVYRVTTRRWFFEIVVLL